MRRYEYPKPDPVTQVRRIGEYEVRIVPLREDRKRPGRGTPFIVKRGERTVRRGAFQNGAPIFDRLESDQADLPAAVTEAIYLLCKSEERRTFKPAQEV